MHAIRVGTSGWSYKDWVGPFYESGTDTGKYLASYAQHFDVVEVDSTFYLFRTSRADQLRYTLR